MCNSFLETQPLIASHQQLQEPFQTVVNSTVSRLVQTTVPLNSERISLIGCLMTLLRVMVVTEVNLSHTRHILLLFFFIYLKESFI